MLLPLHRARDPQRHQAHGRRCTLIDLNGVFAPATTPFDPVTGDVDLVAFRRNARTWLDAPLAGLVLFGSTGEGLLLEDEERVRVLEGLREIAGERLLLAGVGSEFTRGAIRLVRSAAASGADAVLVQPPSYYRPQLTPDVLRDHYVAIADASPIPVILYQVPPAYTGASLEPGLVGELSRHPNIVGIKDSTGDLKAMGQIVEASQRGFQVLGGSGAVLYGALEVGASGGILALANLAPQECCEVFRLKRQGDDAAAGRLQERIAPVHRAIVAGLGVPGVKAAMDLLGLDGGSPRAPLKPLRDKDRVRVRDALQQGGLLDATTVAG